MVGAAEWTLPQWHWLAPFSSSEVVTLRSWNSVTFRVLRLMIPDVECRLVPRLSKLIYFAKITVTWLDPRTWRWVEQQRWPSKGSGFTKREIIRVGSSKWLRR